MMSRSEEDRHVEFVTTYKKWVGLIHRTSQLLRTNHIEYL